MDDRERITSFFKPQSLNTSKDALNFPALHEKLGYERLYLDYYKTLFNAYKSKISLDLPENKIIQNSKWEPLLKAGHHSFVITLNNFLPYMKSKTESGKLVGCFDIIHLHGMGLFELGLAPKDSFMKITVSHGFEDMSFDIMDEKMDDPVCAFTAGMILACYNLSMTMINISKLDFEIIEKMYLESPRIIQVKYGSKMSDESEFTLHPK